MAEENELVIDSGWPLRWFRGQSDHLPGPQTSLALVAVQQVRISDPVIKARWKWWHVSLGTSRWAPAQLKELGFGASCLC